MDRRIVTDLTELCFVKGYSDEKEDHASCEIPERLQTWRQLVLQEGGGGVKFQLQKQIPVEIT